MGGRKAKSAPNHGQDPKASRPKLAGRVGGELDLPMASSVVRPRQKDDVKGDCAAGLPKARAVGARPRQEVAVTGTPRGW